jgi:glycerol-3-phosphate dehydrogenase
VIGAWSGLRPLIADPKGKPSDVSRAHQILAGEPGWLDVAGGKLTTYRLMAEQAVDRVALILNRETPACLTAEEPILSGGAAGSEDGGFSGVVPPAVTQAAVTHYCRREWARHLDDVMIRRTGWRYYHRDHLEIAARAAGWMGDALGWSPNQAAEELERYRMMTVSLAATWAVPPAHGGPADDEQIAQLSRRFPAKA